MQAMQGEQFWQYMPLVDRKAEQSTEGRGMRHRTVFKDL